MSKIIITKGKLLKKDIIEVEYQKTDKTENKPAKCSEEHNTPPHNDLKNAFKSLNIHAAMIGEFISPLSVKDINTIDPELDKDFTVSGFTIVGEDIEQGVILSARKTLRTGKTMGFNTPIIHFEDPSDNPYHFGEELSDCIDKCKKELMLYLGGKFAPDPQGNLFENDKTDKGKTHDKENNKKIIPGGLVSRIPEGTDIKPKRSRKKKNEE